MLNEIDPIPTLTYCRATYPLLILINPNIIKLYREQYIYSLVAFLLEIIYSLSSSIIFNNFSNSADLQKRPYH